MKPETRHLTETPSERIARLWVRPEVTRVRSRMWVVLAICIVAILPVLLIGIWLGDAALAIFQTYIDQLVDLL